MTPTASIAWWAVPGTRSLTGGEVAVPVGQHVRELVEAERDRRDVKPVRSRWKARSLWSSACGRPRNGRGPGLWVVVMGAPVL